MPDRVDDRAVAVRTDDWPAHATDAIVKVVGTVRDKTTGPAITVARAAVYGLVVAVLGTLGLILVLVGTVRALDELIPRGVWIVYAILGTVFVAAGTWCWSRRKPPQE
jgi:hypothetical protein